MLAVPAGGTLPEQNLMEECGVPLCSVIRVLVNLALPEQ